MSASPPASNLTLDTTACEASLETLMVIAPNGAAALTTSPNGIVYFSQSSPANAIGVYALAWPSAERRLSDDEDVLQLLLDGTDLLVVQPRGIRRLPTTGGPSTALVTLPSSELLTTARLDATHLYWGTISSAADAFSLKRMARDGGDTETIFTAQKDVYLTGSFVTADQDVLITGADFGIHRAPKRGGAPTLLHAQASLSLLVTAKGSLFSDQPLGPLLRSSTEEPSVAPAPIGWPAASSLVGYGGAPGNSVADDTAAYFSFQHFEGSEGRVAFARLPGPGEAAAVSACTTAGPTLEVPEAMALDATHLYALLSDVDHHSTRIVRMPR